MNQQNDLVARLRAREITETNLELLPVPAGHALAGVGAAALAARLAGDSNWAGIRDASHVALIDVRHGMRGLAERAIVRLVQLPVYYSEVLDYQPLPVEALALRTELAIESGYLAIGPDECLALEWKMLKGEGCPMYHVWENDDAGKVRRVCEHFFSIDWVIPQKSIGKLDRTETKRAIETTLVDLACALKSNWSPRAERLQRTLDLLQEYLQIAPGERTDSGALVERYFIEGGNATKAFAYMSHSRAWATYPTSQDNWYYAVYFNPELRQIVTYAEGDLTRVTCDSADQFESELASLARFHGTRRSPCGYSHDDAETVVYFETASLLRGDVAELRFNPGSAAKDSAGHWIPPLVGHLWRDHPIVPALQSGQSACLPKTAFTIDLLNPLAFQPYVATLERSDNRLRVRLEVDGDAFTAEVEEAKVAQEASC